MIPLPLKNFNRTMNLMTKTVAETLPPLGSQDGKGMQATAYVKFFGAGWTWYATEMDPETGECFGLVFSPDCPEGELGYFSVLALSKVTIRPLGAGIERDLYFKPTTLQNCKNPCSR